MMNNNKRNSNIDWIDALKYVIVAAIIIYIGMILAMKGESKAPFSKVADKVEKAADLSELKMGNVQTFKKFYGLNEKDYDGVMLYSAKSSMGVEELLVIKMKDTGQAEEIEKAIQTRLDSRREDFEGYGASQTKLLQNAVSVTKGNYIFLAVSKDAQKFQKAFLNSL